MPEEPQDKKVTQLAEKAKWTRDDKLKLAGIVISSVIAAVAITGLLLGQRNVSRQLGYMQESMKRQWRPYLNMTQGDWQLAMAFLYGDTGASEWETKDIGEVPIDTREFTDATFIGIELMHGFTLWNNGATPLRVTAMLSSTMTEHEWVDKYSSSPHMFIDSLRDFAEFDTLPKDIVVMPGDSTESSMLYGVRRRMPMKSFLDRWKKDSSIILYPYIYAEYEDIFGNNYNSLLVEFQQIRIEVSPSDNTLDPVMPPLAGVEKYRWDIRSDSL